VLEKTSGGVTVVNNETFTYDVENRRIGDDLNGTQSWTAYDGQNVYADFNSGGSLTYRYLYGTALDSLFARYDGTTAIWYLTDNLGSVRQMTTTAGSVQDQLTYDSFGNILTETHSTNGDRFKFTGREWDSALGLQFNRARYYNPADGRWITQDPLTFASGDMNLYEYALNQPIRFLDPSGTQNQFPIDLGHNGARGGQALLDGIRSTQPTVTGSHYIINLKGGHDVTALATTPTSLYANVTESIDIPAPVLQVMSWLRLQALHTTNGENGTISVYGAGFKTGFYVFTVEAGFDVAKPPYGQAFLKLPLGVRALSKKYSNGAQSHQEVWEIPVWMNSSSPRLICQLKPEVFVTGNSKVSLGYHIRMLGYTYTPGNMFNLIVP